MIGFQIIFAPLFVSYTIAGSQSLRSVSLERFVIKIICQLLFFFCECFSITSLNQRKKTSENVLGHDERKLSITKASSRDGDMLKYIVSPTTPALSK